MSTREDYLRGSKVISDVVDGFRLKLDTVELAPDERARARQRLR